MVFGRVVWMIVVSLAFAGLLSPTGASARGVEWLFDSPAKMVAHAPNYRDVKCDNRSWQGTIDSPDPIIELNRVTINAGKSKYLYVKLAAESGQSLQVFFSGGGAFSETLSFRSGALANGGDPAVYRFDLSHFTLWNGIVRSLRLDMDGADNGAVIRLYGVGCLTSRSGRLMGFP